MSRADQAGHDVIRQKFQTLDRCAQIVRIIANLAIQTVLAGAQSLDCPPQFRLRRREYLFWCCLIQNSLRLPRTPRSLHFGDLELRSPHVFAVNSTRTRSTAFGVAIPELRHEQRLPAIDPLVQPVAEICLWGGRSVSLEFELHCLLQSNRKTFVRPSLEHSLLRRPPRSRLLLRRLIECLA